MNKIINEKASIIMELCLSVTPHLFVISPDELYKKYDIPTPGYGTSFTIGLNSCYYEQRILYKGDLVDLKISRIKKLQTNESQILISVMNEYVKISIEESQLSTILSSQITLLQESAKEHEYKSPSEETIKLLQNLCAKDVHILLHGTDLTSVEKILSQGLKIWDLGQACRTTAMINNDYKKILAYNYAEKCFRPRNILIVLPNDLFNANLETPTSKKRSMEKCQKCTARIFDEYDGWCYKENYFYESIAEETENGWVIPPKYIYGYMDYNGNFFSNKNYNPVLDTNDNQQILRKKLHFD